MTLESVGKLRELATGPGDIAGGYSSSYLRSSSVLDCANEIEREIAEKYMELPLDADGIPVHIGDKMANVYKPNDEYTVTAITEGGCHVCGGDCSFFRTGQLCHAKPDKLKERVYEFGRGVHGCTHEEYEDAVAALCSVIREMAKEGEL